jgi:hypothetical protein
VSNPVGSHPGRHLAATKTQHQKNLPALSVRERIEYGFSLR